MTGSLKGVRISLTGQAKMEITVVLQDVPVSQLVQAEFLPEGPVVLELFSAQKELPGLRKVTMTEVPEAFR